MLPETPSIISSLWVLPELAAGAGPAVHQRRFRNVCGATPRNLMPPPRVSVWFIQPFYCRCQAVKSLVVKTASSLRFARAVQSPA